METACTGTGIVVDQILACAIVETWLILTLVDISVTLFPGVARLTGAQEIADEVGTRGVVEARVRITLVYLWNK